MKSLRSFLLLFLLPSYVCFSQSNSKRFDILIVRDSLSSDKSLTIGSLYLNDDFIGYTYENTSLEIPTGDYKGLLRYNSGKNFVQSANGRLSKKGDFLIEISNVDGRSDILLHQGNKAIHSKGCILLGPAKRKSGGVFINEKDPLKILYNSFFDIKPNEITGLDTPPNSTPNRDVTIRISK